MSFFNKKNLSLSMKRGLYVFLILTVLFNSHVFSQSFSSFPDDTIPVVVNSVTLNNAWAGGINFPLFSEIDLNGDGIHDMFMYERDNGRISTFINDGSPGIHAWHYSPQYVHRTTSRGSGPRETQ